ncbi:LINE-1 reverse transcriptase like protein [Dictyocoela muelleri]|nr:LINE-1 reverse transcriptase like protein [Dictyocoela muelleri]
MGSEFLNDTSEMKKMKKTTRTGVKSIYNNTKSNTTTNKRKILKELIDCECLLNLIADNQNNDGRIKRGGWAKITANYNLKNRTSFDQTSIRNFYITYLKNNTVIDKNNDKSEISNENKKNDENKINNNDSHKNNTDINNTKNQDTITGELNNILTKLKDTFMSLKIENLETWKPTRKISSLTLNHKLLENIDKAASILINHSNINDIGEIVKLIYSAQVIYDENIKKPPPRTNWVDNIKNKIQALSNEKEIVEKYLSDVPLSPAQQKLFKYICAKRRIKKSEVENCITKNELREINFKIENEILLYSKRLEVHFNKKKHLRENFLYECNRKKFYREIASDNTQKTINVKNESILDFWNNQLCEFPKNDFDYIKNIVSNTLKPIENEMKINIDEKLINETIENLPNWKAAGIDRIYNFFIKNLKSIRKPLIKEIQRLCIYPNLIPKIFFQTITYMIPKKNDDPNPSEFRPISCMSNIYKLITKILTHNLYNILDVNEVISFNQIGARKNTMASKEQLLFNHSINVVNDFKLKTIWFDIQKAYDSVPFEYVNEILKRLNLPANYIEIMNKLQKELEMNIYINNKNIGIIKPCRGIIQGDSLSPLIFTLCMEPVSRILNQHHNPKVEIKYKDIEFSINHLLYMDDIKIFAEDDEKLKNLTTEFTKTLNKIGLKHNKSKSCTNVITMNDIADIICPLKGYKYLGLFEDSDNKFKNVNIDIVNGKMNERIKKLCNTSLNSTNMFNAFNEFALSLLNYFVGTINMPENRLSDYDTTIRKILMENDIHNKTACKERLYLKRKYMGRGLNSLEFTHDKLLHNILQKIEMKSNSCVRNKLIKSVYENFSISLKELKEKLKNKYNIQHDHLNSYTLEDAFQKKMIEKIKKKELHGTLFKEFESLNDIKDSSIWLKRGKLSPKTEGYLCNIQDRNIFYQKPKCHHCNKSTASVDHIATRCEKMLYFDYKKRHDDIQKIILISILNKYTNSNIKHYKYQKTKNVHDLEDIKILVDIPIKTDILVTENRPDIVVINKKNKEICFIEVGITNQENLKQVESFKKRKYELLAREYGRIKNMNVKIVPFVMTWDGHVTTFNKKYRESLGITTEIFGYIQSACLNRTLECLKNKNEQNDLSVSY